MNYVNKISELSRACLSVKDFERVQKWLKTRDLLSIKEIVTSEFIKFKAKRPKTEEEQVIYGEKDADFTSLESTIIEYLKLNNYSEEDYNLPTDEEY